MEKPREYSIDMTDDELRKIIIGLQKHDDFADFCNIVTSRATKCWQSGLEDYAFGEKRYSDWQSKKTVLEMLDLETSTGSYNSSYVSYVKESLCLYYKVVLRKNKLKRILNEI